MSFSAIYDACVLFPFETRDILMYAAYTRVFRVHWSEQILDECTRNLVKRNKANIDGMKRMVQGMNKAFPDASVPLKDYEPLIAAMTCDKNDRHVLSAAVARKMDYLVTANFKDFPYDCVRPYKIEVCSADDFVIKVIEENPTAFLHWYNKMVDARIANAKKRNWEPVPDLQSIATHSRNKPMPKTGDRILQLLSTEEK